MTQFNLATVAETVAAEFPDRPLIVHRGRTFTQGELVGRATRLASYLHAQGLGCHAERSQLAGHEVGQDLLGIYAHNGHEWLESMMGSYRARVAPFNVNYRYVHDELVYLLRDAGATALIYHAAFAPRVAEIRDELPALRVLLQIEDGSGNALLPGAVDYEEALAGASPEPPPVEPSPDDLYVLYTGGTTGMPKGVLWRQHDIFMSAMGGRPLGSTESVSSYEELVERVRAANPTRLLILPPLMHGAAQWAVYNCLAGGNAAIFPDTVEHLDPVDVVRTIEREKPIVVAAVGDAMARPIVDEIAKGTADVSSLFAWANGGAPLSPSLKQRILELLPHLFITDGMGSSESGAQMTHVSTSGNVGTGTFTPSPEACVVSAERDRLLEPGEDEQGWLAQGGWVPLGYKGDEAKTAATFPVIDGIRYSIPGDRARRRTDGAIELLGRDSVTINSGGEKIFAEEVEMAIASHPAVADVVVTGRPSERWGQEVVAVVALRPGSDATAEELCEHASTHIARYKLPKAVVFREKLVRSPAGKADYRWAKAQAEAEG